ncbi:MAG TPA: hypothetical protein VER33_26255 [Polyangiaceae bacterium]|nr:hypothetical protein [Polyangiaceae bacterium]
MAGPSRDTQGSDPRVVPRLRDWFLRLTQGKHFRERERGVAIPEAGADAGPRRPRRWRLILVLIAALAAYPLLGTLALWSGFVEWAVRSDDLRVELEGPAYTIWPGRVHVKHARVLVNGETQFILRASDLVANLKLLSLFNRKFHVVELEGRAVRYQMRVRMESEQGMEQRIAAYPPLKDLPGANVIREKDAKDEASGGGWTVEIEGVDVSVEELWFLEYRYLGDGRLRGGFLVGPGALSVTTAVQNLGPGELRFGAEQPLAKDLRAQIDANIPRLNPAEQPGAGFLKMVTARINLRANVQALTHLGAYFEGMQVSGGQGPLTLDFYLENGVLGAKSHLDYQTASIGLKGRGFGVQTDWRLELDGDGEAQDKAAGLPLLRSASKATYVSLARRDRELTLQIHGHEEELALDTVQLSSATPLKRASVRMPTLLSVDLDDLDVAFPEGTPLRVTGGEARGSLRLDMGPDYWIRGPMSLVAEGAEVAAPGIRVSGNTKLQGQLRVNPKLEIHHLEDVALMMRHVGVQVGDERVQDWWMTLASERLTFRNSEPTRIHGTVTIRAKDLEPILEGLAEKDKLTPLVPLLTSLDNFEAKITLRKTGPATDVTLASQSDVWDVAGRIYSNGEEQRMALVVGGQAVSVGIARAGGELEIQPFAKTDWLNARLRAFPKPLVQMAPSKP